MPDLAVAMAADESVKTGTRYDALRILGVESWKKRGATLTKYLGAGIHAEVQSGAIGAVNDMQGQGSRPGSDCVPEESLGPQSQRRAERAAPG